MATAESRILGLVMAANAIANDGPTVKNDCHGCQHRRDVPGNAHIQCVKPDADMTGNPHGIKNGWFMYPLLFDPTWMTAKCKNFEPVSQAGKSAGESM